MANARIGEIIVSADPEAELVALGLGSCIGVVMIDRHAHVAGLAHVMLPQSGKASTPEGKFADTAVPALLASVLALGAVRGRLRIAIAGGAAMFGGAGTLDIGARNAEAVRKALAHAQLRCHAAETGGDKGRTVKVKVGSGSATTRIVGAEPIELLGRAS